MVMEKIFDFIYSRDDIRAAILNGSRCNPNAPIDEYQDYDIWFIVKEPEVFLKDQSWIKQFGQILIKQINPSEGEKLYYGEATQGLVFLILFKQGFRLDLSFSNISELEKGIDDSLSYVLVDKDNLIPELPAPSEKSYWVNKPQQAEYDFVVNEFLWCLPNVVKGIMRDELPFAKGVYDNVARPTLLKMLKWYIGLNHNWQVNVGKFNKWLKGYLPVDYYQLYVKTYSGSDYYELWDSIYNALILFRKVAQEISVQLNYPYPYEDDINVETYLKEIKERS